MQWGQLLIASFPQGDFLPPSRQQGENFKFYLRRRKKSYGMPPGSHWGSSLLLSTRRPTPLTRVELPAVRTDRETGRELGPGWGYREALRKLSGGGRTRAGRSRQPTGLGGLQASPSHGLYPTWYPVPRASGVHHGLPLPCPLTSHGPGGDAPVPKNPPTDWQAWRAGTRGNVTLERKPGASFPEIPSGLSQQDGLGAAAARGQGKLEENTH